MSAKRKILPLFIPHLGCGHDCIFCNQKRISGALKAVTAAEVGEALRTLTERDYELAFYGGSFTALPVEEQRILLDAVQPYRAAGVVSEIRVSTRPDAINDTVLSLLREKGVGTVELGAQSMDDAVLRTCGRGHSAADTEKAAKLVRQRGFHLILQMMTGLPGSSDALDIETAKRLIALRPDDVRIYPTVILKDTPLAEAWERGAYREHTVEDAVRVCAEILPLFMAAGIPVIRLGLNPSDALSAGNALAGAYHPALGELVQSRVYFNKVKSMLPAAHGDVLRVTVAAGERSKMIGQKRCNIAALQAQFGFCSVRVREDENLRRGEIEIDTK